MRLYEGREEEIRISEKRARKTELRKNREEFKSLLAKHIQEGLIDSKTRWKEYLPVIEQEDATKNLCLNFSGSQPQELFYDAIEQLETLHSENSEIVARAMHMTKLSFHVSSSTEALTT